MKPSLEASRAACCTSWRTPILYVSPPVAASVAFAVDSAAVVVSAAAVVSAGLEEQPVTESASAPARITDKSFDVFFIIRLS